MRIWAWIWANLLQPFLVSQQAVFAITSVSHFCVLFWFSIPPQLFGWNLFWSNAPFCRIKPENGLVKIAKHACVCSWSHFFSSICQWSICFDLAHLLLINRSALVPRLEGDGGHIQNTSIWNLPSTKGSTLILLKFKSCKLGSAPARKWKGTGGGRQELNFWPKNPSSLSWNPSRPRESSLRWHNWLGKP